MPGAFTTDDQPSAHPEEGIDTASDTATHAIPDSARAHYRVQPESMAIFLSDTWLVASEADRIGYRLKGGTPLDFVPREPPFGAGDDPSNIVDACYPIGSIQVPSGQQPIVLHRDAVSGGGYMMIGTVISADMDLIGQMQPNTKVRFVAVTMDQALAARADRADRLRRIRAATAA